MAIEEIKEFVQNQHRGQTDKSGKPYIGHLYRVADQVKHDEQLYKVALLHDVVEDTDATLEGVSAIAGYEIAAAVDAMTKREGEDYQDYLNRVKANELARRVKMADMTDNMNLYRIPNPQPKDLKRIKKYAEGYLYLMGG